MSCDPPFPENHQNFIANFLAILTTWHLLFESAPAPPSAGFNVTFEDLTPYTSAGAPPIFARLAAVKSRELKAPEIPSRRVTKGRVNLLSILARRRVSRGPGEEVGGGN